MKHTNGPKLKKMRETQGLTQSRVAKSLGHKSAQLVSNWERGSAHVPVTSIKKVSKLYKVKPVILVDMVVNDFKTHVIKTARV